MRFNAFAALIIRLIAYRMKSTSMVKMYVVPEKMSGILPKNVTGIVGHGQVVFKLDEDYEAVWRDVRNLDRLMSNGYRSLGEGLDRLHSIGFVASYMPSRIPLKASEIQWLKKRMFSSILDVWPVDDHYDRDLIVSWTPKF